MKTKKVIMAAGAQQMDRGIQRGLVNIIRIIAQKARPSKVSITLDCRKISSTNIIENSMNFRRNFASLRALEKFKKRGCVTFFE